MLQGGDLVFELLIRIMMFIDSDEGVFGVVQKFALKVIDTQYSLAFEVAILNVLEMTL